MLSVNAVPPVGANEKLSRFVLSSRHFRKDFNTLKADAFVPHPHEELSVNRELEATDNETWTIGRTIADGLSKTLYGRGDVIAATYHSQKLKTIEAPVLGNPNHVNVIGWIKDDKPSQKLIAQEIAAVAKFVKPPLVHG